jgi:anaerobic magnesium-protoporphyrin IX monomethyl ester cyclase
MDLLLTHGYFLHEDAHERQIMKPYVPLGILYICSHLRARNLDVEVFDSTFSSKQELFAALAAGPPSVVGIYSNLMTRASVVELLRVARDCGWRTVVGGPEAATYAAEYLACGADVVVAGEGEVTLEELLPALKAGADLDAISGIAYLDSGGNVRHTPPRAQIRDLDAQPWPARHAVDIPQYLDTWRRHHGQGSVSLITARGCPFHCRWCSHQVFGKTHRRRKPSCVADELAFLLARYSPDMAWMADDVFTIHPGWLFDYARELQERGIHLPFECISRADRMNERVVDTLAQMGCFRVWIGSESGSQRILDAMERGVTVEQVQRAIQLCKSRGIQTGMFLMWGYEGEELDDIEATVAHVKRADPDVFLTTVAYPIKGTPYYESVQDRVASAAEWAQSSDREFRVRGRHSRRFYQLVDQLLRDEVEHSRRCSDPALAARIAQSRSAMLAAAAEVEA